MPGAIIAVMSELRLVALLSVVGAAGCYSDAPPQSTLPEPYYVSGPPGAASGLGTSTRPSGTGPGYAAANPGYGPAQPRVFPGATGDGPTAPGDATGGAAGAADDPAGAGEPDGVESGEVGSIGGTAPAAPDAAGPPGPGPLNDAQGGDIAGAITAPDAIANPTASVTDPEIDTALSGYGQWVETDDYGQVWRPDATQVGVDFTPYESGGSWAYTDAGWGFACDYPWGWLPFHYGRWAWFHDYWGWVPGHRWSPAWVEWRHGGGVVGWRPMGPGRRDHRGDGHRFGGGSLVRDHRHAEQHDAHWRFTAVSDFARPHVRSHLYGNLAEGLRVTSTVAAPPLHTRTTVRAGDLMRNRFAVRGTPSQPGTGRYGGPQAVRDHRVGPVRAYQPPVRAYQPPVRAYQPPAQQQRYYAPTRTYQPPTRAYAPPARTYAPPSRTWSPPSRPSSPPSSGGSHSTSGGSHSTSGGSHSTSGGGSHSTSGGGSHSSGGGHHR